MKRRRKRSGPDEEAKEVESDTRTHTSDSTPRPAQRTHSTPVSVGQTGSKLGSFGSVLEAQTHRPPAHNSTSYFDALRLGWVTSYAVVGPSRTSTPSPRHLRLHRSDHATGKSYLLSHGRLMFCAEAIFRSRHSAPHLLGPSGQTRRTQSGMRFRRWEDGMSQVGPDFSP